MFRREDNPQREVDTTIEETLKTLRTNIHFLDPRKTRVVLCTSTIPKEGKSFIAANYASSSAACGERVLLIDCDIRKPKVHSYFNISVENGLTDVLLKEASFDQAVVRDIEDNLDLLPSKPLPGKANELFLSDGMRDLLTDLKTRYDIIIIDTPPLLVAADAAVLSQYSDGLIYICGYNMITKRELFQAKRILARANANVYGLVVNKIETEGYTAGNYGYYSYAYKYRDGDTD